MDGHLSAILYILACLLIFDLACFFPSRRRWVKICVSFSLVSCLDWISPRGRFRPFLNHSLSLQNLICMAIFLLSILGGYLLVNIFDLNPLSIKKSGHWWLLEGGFHHLHGLLWSRQWDSSKDQTLMGFFIVATKAVSVGVICNVIRICFLIVL